jgi:hypothetical protein
MKQFLFILIFLFAISYSKGQIIFPEGKNDPNPEKQDISPTKEVGYGLTGAGAATIANTALKLFPVRNPTLWYIGGSVALATGLYLLIFADDDYKPHYWNGMQGYAPQNDSKNFQFPRRLREYKYDSSKNKSDFVQLNSGR